MDLRYALSKISDIPDAGDLSAESDRVEAAEIVTKTIEGLGQQVDTLTKKVEGLERVAYLLVESHPDDRLKNEMHTTYSKIVAGLASPEE